MRILMVSDGYTAQADGLPTSIELFRLRLVAAGHAVTLLVPEGAAAQDSLDVLRIPPRWMFMDPEDRSPEAAPARALAERLRAADYDIVHVHAPFLGNAFGTRLAKFLSLPSMETWMRTHAVPLCAAPTRACRASSRLCPDRLLPQT